MVNQGISRLEGYCYSYSKHVHGRTDSQVDRYMSNAWSYVKISPN